MPPKKDDKQQLWLAAAAATGVAALSYAAYRYFFKSKTLSVAVLIKIMTELHRAFEDTMGSMKETQEELQAQARGMPQEKVMELQRTFMEAFRERITKREAEVCEANGITPEQLEAAVLAHKEDPTVQFLVEGLSKYYVDEDEEGEEAAEVDEAELPSLEMTVRAMTTMLELSIVVMEEVHKQVAAKLDPEAAKESRPVRLTPQFVSLLNRLYAEQFLRVRTQVMEKIGISDRLLSAASAKYQNEPQFLAMIAQHTKDKNRRFQALGLSQSSPADDDE